MLLCCAAQQPKPREQNLQIIVAFVWRTDFSRIIIFNNQELFFIALKIWTDLTILISISGSVTVCVHVNMRLFRLRIIIVKPEAQNRSNISVWCYFWSCLLIRAEWQIWINLHFEWRRLEDKYTLKWDDIKQTTPPMIHCRM